MLQGRLLWKHRWHSRGQHGVSPSSKRILLRMRYLGRLEGRPVRAWRQLRDGIETPVYGLVQWEYTMAKMLSDAGYATGACRDFRREVAELENDVQGP
jgi:hypothetical protein